MAQDALIAPIRDWLVDEALGESDIVQTFSEMCDKLVAVGIPISRARLLWPTLHPLFEAETVIWDQGKPPELEQFPHQDQETDAWKRSPLKYVIESGVDLMRRQLEGPNEVLDYDILHELKERGHTDYLILATSLEDLVVQHRMVRNSRGILVTWASSRPGGFSNDHLETLQQIQRRLAVAIKTIILTRISRNITTTYLGQRAGTDVLNGKIRLGDGTRTNAVVWYSDLRDSTMHAESMPPDEYFDMLNAYFSATAGPVMAEGGEVLDFIGDAVLAIFPYSKHTELKRAAKAANRALDQTCRLGFEINEERAAAKKQTFRFGIGINTGEVMFGNIGIPQRLSFSAIGPSINEVSRIEEMTKFLQHPVLAGREFAELNPDRWNSIGQHKLEGMLDDVELFSFKGQRQLANQQVEAAAMS